MIAKGTLENYFLLAITVAWVQLSFVTKILSFYRFMCELVTFWPIVGITMCAFLYYALLAFCLLSVQAKLVAMGNWHTLAPIIIQLCQLEMAPLLNKHY